MTFFHTPIGSYIVQTVLHAFIALVVVELSLFIWEVRSHIAIFRYRMLTLTLPVFMQPFFQVISPQRGSWYFRLDTAIFDSLRWLDIKAAGAYPFGLVFGVFLFLISAVFVLQEIVPIFRSKVSAEDHEEADGYKEVIAPLLAEICAMAGTPKPAFRVIDEDVPVLFTHGGRSHTIVISSHVIDSLGAEELKAALAHEVVHMMRHSSLKTRMIYLIRMAMFYNPVSLVEFRRIVHDEEFICDGIAAGMTGNPEALKKALRAFYYNPEIQSDAVAQVRERIERHSHNLVLDERTANLDNTDLQKGAGWPQFIMTLSAIVVTCYLVV